ncbi:MAG: hypothetical protein PHW74_11755 [Desulfobacca sp.]|nr:hypothetical protein [Desulfobacca sp.]
MSIPAEEPQESRQESGGGPQAGAETEPQCPFCQLYAALQELAGPQSEFGRHLHQARVEFYKALRALIDQRIGALEKTAKPGPKKGFQNINVESD